MLWILANAQADPIAAGFPPCFNHRWSHGGRQAKACALSWGRGGRLLSKRQGRGGSLLPWWQLELQSLRGINNNQLQPLVQGATLEAKTPVFP